MDREYEIFEVINGSPIWRGHAVGLPDARFKLLALSRKTSHECLVIHLQTKEVVARLNFRAAGKKPVVIQITYEPCRAIARSEALRLHGYEVSYLCGNDAAKLVLDMVQPCDLFMVGVGAADEIRKEMVRWLKDRYPRVPVMALNPAEAAQLPEADFNVKSNGPETYLPVVALALGRPGPSGSGPSTPAV